MSDIDILTIDELLIIFNLLSLYDKLMAMRVCKKWHYTIRDTHAWKVIDLRDKGPIMPVIAEKGGFSTSSAFDLHLAEPGQNVLTFRDCLYRSVYYGEDKRYHEYNWDFRDHKRWEFPRNPRDILSFLCIFAGVALREIYLTTMSVEIMDFLRRSCPNIVTLDFCSSYLRLEDNQSGLQNIDIPIDRMDIDDDIKQKLYLPFKLKRLGLTGVNCLPGERKTTLNERIISCVANYDCSELRSICLCNFELSSKGMQKLVEIPSLREIELFSCRCSYSTSYQGSPLDDILTNSIGVLRKLTCLRIYRFQDTYYQSLSDFLGCIGKWENLRELSLICVRFSEPEFERMIPALLNLKKLRLYTASATSHIVTIIGNQCRKLESLQLRWGKYTGESLLSLCDHPTLEVLEVDPCLGLYDRVSGECIVYSKIAETEWLHKVFTMLETLPKIKHIKFFGTYMVNIYNEGTFPIIQSADIQVIEFHKREKEKEDKKANSLAKSLKRMFKR
ncbi:uncharacterized protein [Amphiura filiformis]|uniref:uncharacterized protein n=1 Tax=Amphiura filiformis TaxID=82378 RepID=UPI003B20E01F